MKIAVALLLTAGLPAALAAQRDVISQARMPADIETRVRAELRDPDALRLAPPAYIPPDSVVAGDVVVEGGSLTLAGRVTGDVVVVDGDLVLRRSATIGGDAIVVGGALEHEGEPRVGGTLLTFGRDVRDWRGREEDDGRRDRRGDGRRSEQEDAGLRLGVTVDNNYNRVEGLPIRFGPVIRTPGANSLRVEGMAVWRTEPSEWLDDEVGYDARVEQRLRGGRFRLGGSAFSLVRPIEEHGLSSLESGLSSVIFHTDPQDYYQLEGWGVHAEWRPMPDLLRARVGYRAMQHAPLAISDPWSLLDGDDPWRRQPLVGTGDVDLLELDVEWDGRDDDEETTRGWYAALGVRHSLDQELVLPRVVEAPPAMPPLPIMGPTPLDDFTAARVDVRRYTPVDRNSTLNLRLFAAGAVEESVLPPQFQHALGGIGTLPGYGLLSAACGGRSASVSVVGAGEEGNRFAGAYGCDRVVLAQMEYRGGLDLEWDGPEREDGNHRDDRERDRRERDRRDRNRDDDRDDDHERDDLGRDDHDHGWEWSDARFDVDADWVVFANAARGWAFGDLPHADRFDTDAMYDVGLGLLVGDGGVYAALPFTGEDRSVRVFVRLTRRF